MDIKKLEKIYSDYGFEVVKENSQVAVFLYKKGRYFGSDIIPLINDPNSKNIALDIKNRYSNLGYATTIKELTCEEEAEEELFKSFFSFKASLERLKKRYVEFENKQTVSLVGSKYQYIESPYEIYDNDSFTNGLVNKIIKIITEETGPYLIIIEAAAGFGKTSTSYQIMKELVENAKFMKLPIMTELSRNRVAAIFRYILLDEIDLEFQTLGSELVIREIKKGKIPLIIDGFDELLDKVSLEADLPSLEEVEPMLNTISNLLEGDAKVILTTRKTAIFNGAEFDKWLSQWDNKFQVVRISLKEPKIINWLGDKRVKFLEENNIDITFLSNPVLLTYLKNLNDEEYQSQIIRTENLIDQYFEKMLEREKVRQNLFITAIHQYEIFKNVVKLLVELDTSVESKEFFKEIIKEQNIKLLEFVKNTYPEKTTIDNLVDTLSTHALLDRKGREGNQIGFINDFIFGIFIGEIIIADEDSQIREKYSSYMIELALTAFRAQNKEKKGVLWEKLLTIKDKFSPEILFNFDSILKNEIFRDYADLMLKELNIFSLKFCDYKLCNVVFISCHFKKCTFDLKSLEGVSFIDCCFDNCTIIENLFLDNYSDINIIKCSQKGNSVLLFSDAYLNTPSTAISEIEINILLYMYEYSITKKHFISSLMQRIEGKSVKKISNALIELEKKKLIAVKGNVVEFNINKITEIKLLLKK